VFVSLLSYQELADQHSMREYKPVSCAVPAGFLFLVFVAVGAIAGLLVFYLGGDDLGYLAMLVAALPLGCAIGLAVKGSRLESNKSNGPGST
jgi:hypothetical protein